VLYVCIPVHNEAATVGVLLWRLRTVLGETGRDYEVVVFDDGSTDSTAEVVAPYARVLPLTLLGGRTTPRGGRSAATEALVRHVVAHSRYPRRDACVVLQGDFTDRAEDVPALLPAFDAGADLVVGRRAPDPAQPLAERRLRRMGPWVLRPLLRVDGADDLLTSFRLYRVAVLRDLVRARGAEPLAPALGWAGVVELLAAAMPFARRVETVDAPGRYDVRPRESRLDWAAELRGLARYAWRARGTHARPGVPRPARPALTPSTEVAANALDGSPAGLVPAADGTTEVSPPTRRERPRRAERRELMKSTAEAEPTGTPAPPRQRRDTRPPPGGPGASPVATASGDPAPAGDGAGAPGDSPHPRTRGGRRRGAERAMAEPAPAGAAEPAPTAVRARQESTATGAEPTVDPDAAGEGDDAMAATDGQPARRKKRRRRRGRAAGADALLAGSDAASTGDDRPTEEEPATREAPGVGDAGDADLDAESADAQGPARRRKRRRSRSARHVSGVPSADAPADGPGASPANGAHGAPPADAPPLDRSSLPA